MAKVYTRVVWQWEDGVLVQKEADWFDYIGPIAEAKATPSLVQAHFRFRSDAGTADATPTWLASDDTNINVDVTGGDVTFRLRILIQEAGGADSANRTISLRTSEDNYAANITTTTTKVRSADASSSADQTAITVSRLTGTGSFTEGEYDETGIGGAATADFTASTWNEYEFGLKVVASAVSDGEIFDFRVYIDSAALNGGYTVTPRITVSKNPAFGSHITSAARGTTSTTDTTYAFNEKVTVAVGDLAIAHCRSGSGTIPGTTGCSDNLSNTWTNLNTVNNGSSGIRAFYSKITNAGDMLVTLTYTSGNSKNQVLSVYKGAFAASPLDANPTWITDSTTPYDCPSSGTLAQADELVFGFFGGDTTAALSATSPSVKDNTAVNGATVAISHRVVAATTAVAPQFTGSSAAGLLGTASFKKAAGNQDGALSATGTGTATFAAVGQTSLSLSATGTGTATFAGLGQTSLSLSATGTGAATFTGASAAAALTAISGTATVSFVSSADDTKPFSISGTGTATFTGESTADSSLSATGTGTATFTGEADADATLSVTGTGTATWLGESTVAEPFSMTGTGTGLFTGASEADAALSATGTGTADFVGVSFATNAPFSVTGTGTATFTGASDADGTLAAAGTGTATFTATSTADSPFSMTGIGTVLFVGAPQADSLLSATGTGTATLVGASEADSVLAATGTAVVSWTYASDGDGAVSSTGTAAASFVATSDADGTLSATGTGTADFVGETAGTISDAALVATGTAAASFVGVDATPATPTTPVVTAGGAGGFPGAWGKPKRRRKKEALDELGELLAAVSEQIAPWTKAKAYKAEQALYRDVLERGRRLDESDTLARIEAEIANVRELLAEIDDEEAVMLLLM